MFTLPHSGQTSDGGCKVVAHALRLTHSGTLSIFAEAAVYLNNSCIPNFGCWNDGRELQLRTAPVRSSGSASVAWTSAPIERLLFAGT